MGGRGVRGGVVVLPGLGLRLRPEVLLRRCVRSGRLGWGTRVVYMVMGGAVLAALWVVVVGRLIRFRADRSSSGIRGGSGTRWALSDRVGASGCAEPIRATRAGRMGRGGAEVLLARVGGVGHSGVCTGRPEDRRVGSGGRHGEVGGAG